MSDPDVWYSKLTATPKLGGPHALNGACPQSDRGTIRRDYKRNAERYESDVADQEWAIIEPMLLR